METSPPVGRVTLNTNTGLSIGIVVVLFGGFAFVLKGQNDTRNELSMQAVQSNNSLINKIEKLDARMTSLESTKNSWTQADMFRWAVHLQQSNSDPKKLQTEGLKVPEPETGNK